MADLASHSDANIVNENLDGVKRSSSSYAKILQFLATTALLGLIPRRTVGKSKYRAFWHCSCGKKFGDDYQEFIRGTAAASVGRLMSRYYRIGTDSHRVTSSTYINRGISAGDLPSTTSQTPQNCSIVRHSTRSQYLLTCLKLGTAPTLVQEDLSAIKLDQEFFSFLHDLRGRTRSRLHSILTFAKITQIKFVHSKLLFQILSVSSLKTVPPSTRAIYPSRIHSISSHLQDQPSWYIYMKTPTTPTPPSS
jgi:hypothetical protein